MTLEDKLYIAFVVIGVAYWFRTSIEESIEKQNRDLLYRLRPELKPDVVAYEALDGGQSEKSPKSKGWLIWWSAYWLTTILALIVALIGLLGAIHDEPSAILIIFGGLAIYTWVALPIKSKAKSLSK